MNRAALVSPCPTMNTATPASALAPSSPTPHTNMPTWPMVENASSRLMWRCSTHMTAPNTAVVAPSATRIARRGSV